MNNLYLKVCCYFFFSSQLMGQYPLAVEEVNEALLKGANAVVRYENIKIDLEDVSKMTMEYSRAITVLHPKAKDYLDVIMYFDKDTKIKNLSVEYLDKNGKLIQKLSKSDYKDYAGRDGFSLITDNMVKYYNYTTDSYPVTIKTSYKRISKTTAFLPSWKPYSGYKVSVEQSNYSLTAAAHIDILHKEMNLNNLPDFENQGFSYSARNLPALKKEPYSPPFNSIVPRVSFVPAEFEYVGYPGSASNWNALGNFNYNAFLRDNKFSKPSIVKSELKPYLSEAITQEDTIAAVYNFVQENTRYISIQIREGGWKPMELDKVHKLKYGDCKALSNYTRAILELYNIPADYVIVEAGRVKESFFDDFASGSQGNHIIVRVPQESKDDIWLECTSNDSPFNFLGEFTDDRKVLVVNKDSSHIVHTPSYAEKNSQVYTSEVDLTDTQVSKIHSEIANYGIKYKYGLYRSKMEDKRRNTHLHKDLFDFVKVSKVLDADYQFDEVALLSTEHYAFEAKDCVEKVGAYLLLPVKFYDLNIPKLSTKRKRINDLDFGRTYHNEVITNYILPDNFKAQIVNDKIEVENDYCHYLKTIKQEQNKLVVKRIFKLKEGRYSAASYLEIAKTFKTLRKEESEKITIKEAKT